MKLHPILNLLAPCAVIFFLTSCGGNIGGIPVVGVGLYHSCYSDGVEVICWGNNAAGQAAPPGAIVNPSGLTAGGMSTCAWSNKGKSDQEFFCWGHMKERNQLVGVSSTNITIGRNDVCGLQESGKVFCNGPSAGLTTYLSLANQIDSISKLSVGANHACAIGSNNKLSDIRCWGHPYPPEIPTQLHPKLIPPVGVPNDIAVNDNFSCGIYDVFEQSVYMGTGVRCWGSGRFANFSKILHEQRLAFPKIVAGSDHVCVASSELGIECFGDNSKGQLDIPGYIRGLKPVSMAAGENHTCAAFRVIASNETKKGVVCWGDNSNGQSTPPERISYPNPNAAPENSATPFIGVWDYFNVGLNRIERINVFIQDGEILLTDSTYLDQQGRVLSGGTMRDAAYTINFFEGVNASTVNISREGISSSAPTTTFTTANGRKFQKQQNIQSLCGEKNYFEATNKLIHTPSHSTLARKIDQCVQRAYHYLKKDSRVDSELWVYRSIIYMLYLADHKYGENDIAGATRLVDKAALLIADLESSDTISNPSSNYYNAYNNASIAFASKSILDARKIDSSNGKAARRLVAYSSLIDKEIAFIGGRNANIAAINYHNDFAIGLTYGIAEANESAREVKAFIKNANQDASYFLDIPALPLGQAIISMFENGNAALVQIKSEPELGYTNRFTTNQHRQLYFMGYAKQFQEYIELNPGFNYAGLEVHHSIEKQLGNARDDMYYKEIDSVENYRGIRADISSTLHQKHIRRCWDELYSRYNRNFLAIPRTEIFSRAEEIDDLWGHLFIPPIRPIPVQGASYMPACPY